MVAVQEVVARGPALEVAPVAVGPSLWAEVAPAVAVQVERLAAQAVEAREVAEQAERLAAQAVEAREVAERVERLAALVVEA